MPVSNPPFPFWKLTPSNEVELFGLYQKTAYQTDIFLKGAQGYKPPVLPSKAGDVGMFGGDSRATTANYAYSKGGGANVYGGKGYGTTGNSAYSYGGQVLIYGGDGGHAAGLLSSSYGGDIFIHGGNAGNSTYYSSAGNVNIRGGETAIGTGANGAFGGSIILNAGVGDSAKASYGGNITLQAAVAGGTYSISKKSGAVRILGGTVAGGVSVGTKAYGGDVYIEPGTGGGAKTYGGHLILKCAGGNVVGQLKMPNIPNADPGISGSLFFDPITNIVKRSP